MKFHTYHSTDMIPAQVEFRQGIHSHQVVNVFYFISGQVQHPQLTQMVQVLNVTDLVPMQIKHVQFGQGI